MRLCFIYGIRSNLVRTSRNPAHWFNIDRLQACVHVDINNKVRSTCTWTDTVLDEVLRVRHLLRELI